VIELLPEPIRALATRIEGVIYVAQDNEERTPLAIGPSSELIFGFTSEELMAEPELFLAHVHPDDQERLRNELRTARGAAYLTLKYRFVHKNGRVVFCRETQVLQGDQGLLAGVTIDVTELELPQRALTASFSAGDARGAVLAICELAAQSFALSWTLYLDARSKARLFNTHGPLGAVTSSRWDEEPQLEPWARTAQNKQALAMENDGSLARLSPELQARCAGARFGFAVPVLPEAEGAPAGVLIGLSRNSFAPLITHQRALEQLARQAAVALQRAELIDALRRTGRERQQLSEALLRGHELERGRLARELHDGAGQTLTAVAIQLDLAEQLANEAGKGPLAIARKQIERTLEELRRVSHALRPAALDDLGLRDALAEMGHAMQTAAFTVRISAPESLPQLSSEVATGLFRIAQAALTNVVRHAHASNASVRLALQNNGLQLEVEDNGRGLSGANAGPGIGVIAMRERALALGGKFSLQSAPNKGARVTVWVPL
jgi:signal transduction histidine kinase